MHLIFDLGESDEYEDSDYDLSDTLQVYSEEIIESIEEYTELLCDYHSSSTDSYTTSISNYVDIFSNIFL